MSSLTPVKSASSGGTGQVTVQNVATLVKASDKNSLGVMLTNLGTVDVFVGFTNGVTTGNGQLLPGLKGASLVVPTTLDIWAIVAAGTQAVSFLELRA